MTALQGLFALTEDSLRASLLMIWQTLWALTLGFGLSAVLQVFVRRESVLEHFGKADLRSVGLATLLGAVSSSCSYAAVAASKTAFKKGANLVPTLAFMFASTNLVLELGLVLWILMGWQFVLAEVVGSFVLIAVMWLMVSLTLPRSVEVEARRIVQGEEEGSSCCHSKAHDSHHDHDHHHGGSKADRWSSVADAFLMDISMMWKEIVIGFLVSGFVMAAMPQAWWKVLFLSSLPGPIQLIENAAVGVLIAMASFVCSVGNLPLASLLWSGGISFGGVISFIYADLVIIPILLLYRKYYGAKAAAYITAVLVASMVSAGVFVDFLFGAIGLIPTGTRPPSPIQMAHFQWNYTTWLDLVAVVFIALLLGIRNMKA